MKSSRIVIFRLKERNHRFRDTLVERRESRSVVKVKAQDRDPCESHTTREIDVDQIVSRRRVYILVRVRRYIHNKDLFVSE